MAGERQTVFASRLGDRQEGGRGEIFVHLHEVHAERGKRRHGFDAFLRGPHHQRFGVGGVGCGLRAAEHGPGEHQARPGERISLDAAALLGEPGEVPAHVARPGDARPQQARERSAIAGNVNVHVPQARHHEPAGLVEDLCAVGHVEGAIGSHALDP